MRREGEGVCFPSPVHCKNSSTHWGRRRSLAKKVDTAGVHNSDGQTCKAQIRTSGALDGETFPRKASW